MEDNKLIHVKWADYPNLFDELNLNKNLNHKMNGKPVHVFQLTPGTNKKIDWICSVCENEWQSMGSNRVAGNGCKPCSGKGVHSDGRNSLAATHPELAVEYVGDATKITPYTNKKLEWKCQTCEHQWKAIGNNRSKHGRGCPACSNLVVHIDGRNSLASTHPDLAKELVGDANSIVAGTNKKLTWCCSKCQHIWKATGVKRAYSGRNCPACVNKELHIDGRNSMAVTHPNLASEYIGDATKIIAGSHKKLDWRCNVCEHEWKAMSSSRAQGVGCPACDNKEIHLDGRNSMATTHPELAEELIGNPTKIVAGTNRKLGWKCKTCSHEWKTVGSARVSGSGCPACSNRQVHNDGRNSLYAISPLLSEELVGNPKTVVATTDATLTWKCRTCSHIWKTSGYHRVTRESGCPSCADYGFQAGEPGIYYVLKVLNDTDDLLYYKGGITSSIERRMRQISSRLPDNLKLVLHNHIEFDVGQDARDLENMLLSVLEIRAPKRDFQGGSELFLYDPLEYARQMEWV